MYSRVSCQASSSGPLWPCGFVQPAGEALPRAEARTAEGTELRDGLPGAQGCRPGSAGCALLRWPDSKQAFLPDCWEKPCPGEIAALGQRGCLPSAPSPRPRSGRRRRLLRARLPCGATARPRGTRRDGAASSPEGPPGGARPCAQPRAPADTQRQTHTESCHRPHMHLPDSKKRSALFSHAALSD